ncbi:MAG: phytoene/squalene synthase family protein [Flavobacteriales bacterium]|jgi:phytoene synthase|nr:squalene/phytoene synthase family protein [Flavobacteriales bacterium]|tara:strand:- start:1004 stop:1840 length:837 start_codon:yes stop_codon:yes gene_type:complete
MKEVYDIVSLECSKLTTKKYSTSFSLGISMLDKDIHNDIYAIYGFVRLADEIVDSFHDFNKKELLKKFRLDTIEAIDNKISLNPILNSFQNVVNTYNLEWENIELFLDSMKHDLENKKHDTESYKKYIKGSAEAVGLMCLKVFCDGDQKPYDNLKDYACTLGSAFQKINFLRDLNADYSVLKRVYFPDLNIEKFNDKEKEKIEDDIHNEFMIALEGIKKLPKNAKQGVYLAYSYYYSLFRKIKAIPASQILSKRIRVNNFQKFIILIKAHIKIKLSII